MENENDFLILHQQGMESLGFWTEEYRETILHSIENRYNTNILKHWTVIDFTINANKVLLKWVKRHRPLSQTELNEKYGRTD